MSRRALLTGVVGGIIGAITAALGVIWSLVYKGSFPIPVYGGILSVPLYAGFVLIPFLIVFEPYAYGSLFGIFSFVLAIFLIVTCILICVGFYGTHKIGGGAMGKAGLIFSILGITSGALLILIGYLTPTFETKLYTWLGLTEASPSWTFYLAFKPNWLMFGTGLIALCITFILLGVASISVREVTEKPSALYAAGILSILGAVAFIIGGIVGIIVSNITIAFIGFGLIFVAFILWTVVFYSSRNL
nr:hypothetical protein [Candidatus Freyarchaeota archaeon]